MVRVQAFLRREDGAASTDFIVITAGIIGVTIAMMAAIADGAITFGDDLENRVAQVGEPEAGLAIIDD